MDERPDTGRDALPGDLETVRPAALGPTTLSHTLSYDQRPDTCAMRPVQRTSE
jgi:hypothetical protein